MLLNTVRSILSLDARVCTCEEKSREWAEGEGRGDEKFIMGCAGRRKGNNTAECTIKKCARPPRKFMENKLDENFFFTFTALS